MKKSVLSGCAALWVLTWASGAMAQQVEAQPADQRVTQVDEIVVTAQRRSQNLQDVPMSVTSISQETLSQSGIVSSQDLTTITPGLIFSRSSVNAQPTIRGIGTRNAAPGDEPNVASYIDGVYQAEQFNNFQEFTNIERIEVLKGPQGALFGRNATGGAINIITRRPSFTPDAEVGFTYGSFNYAKATLHATGPIIDDLLAGSISAYALSEDNYYENIYLGGPNGQSQAMAGRAKFLLTPNERMTFALNAAYAYSDSANVRNGTPVNGNSVGRNYVNNPVANPTNIPLDILVPTKPWTTATDVIPSSTVRVKQVDAHMDVDLGWANLSGLLSYSESRNVVSPDDYDITPLPISQLDQDYHNEGTNQELVLTSTGDGPIEWLVGVSGFQGEATLSIATSGRAGPVPTRVTNYAEQSTRGYAAFAEVTYNAFQNLFLTAGLRYSDDKKTAYNGPADVHGEDSWTNWAPRIVARYELGRNSNVYASYTEGFKTGSFNPTTSGGTTKAANPESVSSYEVGLKTDLTSNIRLNVAAFQSDYTDLQTSINILQPNGLVTSFLENADSAKIKGLEAQADWIVTPEFRLNAGLALLSTEIGHFPNASAPIPNFDAQGNPIGNTTRTVDVSGNNLLRSPEWTFNLGANYTTDVAGGELVLAGNAFWSDKYYADLTNRLTQPAYEVVNLSATFTPGNSDASISVFVQNLTDSEYAMSFSSTAFGDVVQLMKPRWYGVSLNYAF